jgi:hypothetical protein
LVKVATRLAANLLAERMCGRRPKLVSKPFCLPWAFRATVFPQAFGHTTQAKVPLAPVIGVEVLPFVVVAAAVQKGDFVLVRRTTA